MPRSKAANQTPLEVVVFIDYMNLYNDGRRAFHSVTMDPNVCGQIDPMKFARLLVSRVPHGRTQPRTLKQVRVYRGRPDATRDPQGYGAHMRQAAKWQANGVEVIYHPLRYPQDWPRVKEEEKGIDVQIAIDLVTMALNKEFDVAILASTDTDQRPTLKAFSLLPFERETLIEVCAYKSQVFKKKLELPGQTVWCHLIEEPDYRSVRDNTDYNRRPRRKHF
jgi:uncharacterized LabA/DUF88 family protein